MLVGWKLNKEDFEVRLVPRHEAMPLIKAHHYAKGGSNTAVFVHGLYHRLSDMLVGVVWWIPPSLHVGQTVRPEAPQRVLNLTRMVMIPGAPANACSFLLARSAKEIKKDGRYLSLVTYADEAQGHDGGVYKASNWEYVGMTGPYTRWLDPETGQQMATIRRNTTKMHSLGAVKAGRFHKHKFVLHLTPTPAPVHPAHSPSTC
jgi:hypothetical protein